MNKNQITKRNGIISLILGTVILFSGLAIWSRAQGTYYITQFEILFIWCLIYGLAFITIGIIWMNVKSKIKLLFLAIVCLFLLLITPIQRIYNNKTVIEYRAISYKVTETLDSDGQSYHKTVKIFGHTVSDKTIESETLYKKFHVEH